MIRTAIRLSIVFASLVLGIAAAAAAMHSPSWSPLDAFLEHRNAPVSQQAELMPALHQGSAAMAERTPMGAYHPDAVGFGGSAVSGSAALHNGSKANGDAFASDRLHGAFSAGSDTPSASAGNLWRLLGLSHTSAASTMATTHATSTHQPAAPKSPHTTTPHASTGGTPATAVPAAATTVPVILIGSNPTPVSGLIGGGNAASGSTFDPGGSHLHSGSTPGVHGFAATPEPASVLLFSTGLIGLAALLRRRRA